MTNSSSTLSALTFIRQETLSNPQVQNLIESLNAEILGINPDPATHSWSLEDSEIAPGVGAFFIAYASPSSTPPPESEAGCAAIRIIDIEGMPPGSVAEVKRMYVRPSFRRKNVASLILDRLKEEAKSLGVKLLVLETGNDMPGPMALYKRYGFEEIPLFGEYKTKRCSICFALTV